MENVNAQIFCETMRNKSRPPHSVLKKKRKTVRKLLTTKKIKYYIIRTIR